MTSLPQPSYLDGFWQSKPEPTCHGISLTVGAGWGCPHQGQQKRLLIGCRGQSLLFPSGNKNACGSHLLGQRPLPSWQGSGEKWKDGKRLVGLWWHHGWGSINHDCPPAGCSNEMRQVLLTSWRSVWPGVSVTCNWEYYGHKSKTKIIKNHWPRDGLSGTKSVCVLRGKSRKSEVKGWGMEKDGT